MRELHRDGVTRTGGLCNRLSCFKRQPAISRRNVLYRHIVPGTGSLLAAVVVTVAVTEVEVGIERQLAAYG